MTASTTATAADAFQDALLALFQLHGQVLEAADLLSGEFGLTAARWQVLRVLGRRAMTVSQVARRLSLKRQSVQRTVDRLRADGLVVVKPNRSDARAGLVEPTTRGRKVLGALEQRQRAWLEDCLRGVRRGELEQLARTLSMFNARVADATARERKACRYDDPRGAAA
jgi:DNA-binding MarR family transcriptional regulator